MFGRSGGYYDDQNPPVSMPGDALDQNGTDTIAVDESDQNHELDSRKKLLCPHYRQLSSSRLAVQAHSVLVPNKFKSAPNSSSCQSGKSPCGCNDTAIGIQGEKTKLGVHDIEDLVSFGLKPSVKRGVALYRRRSTNKTLQPLGMTLTNGTKGSEVSEIKKGSIVDLDGTLKVGDRILSINGADFSQKDPNAIKAELGKSLELVQLDVATKDDSVMNELEDDTSAYSDHAACPYYLSHTLVDKAELIFAPYQYILDPNIRNRLNIDLEDSVVVLDEAHNVESTLRDSGSGKFGEIELCDLIVILSGYAAMNRSDQNLVEVERGDGDVDNINVCDVAHKLLLFVEALVLYMIKARKAFERKIGQGGAEAAIREYKKYHTPHNTEFESTYHGPTGRGMGYPAKPVGCQPFFEAVGFSSEDFKDIESYADGLIKDIQSSNNVAGGSNEQDRTSNILDRLLEVISKCSYACKEPEHFYISATVRANGNLDHAAGEEESDERNLDSEFKGKPKNLPFVAPKTAAQPDRLANPCLHVKCKIQGVNQIGNDTSIRHGSFCNGSAPKWECVLVINLLTPGILMKELSDSCRTVILASGTLAPISSLAGELNLLPRNPGGGMGLSQKIRSPVSDPCIKLHGRLQIKPKPLEANHVIDLEKQLMAVSIGHMPDGSPLTVTYKNYSAPGFFSKLGHAIAKVIESIPRGGILIFLPSYSFMKKCVRAWNPDFDRSAYRGPSVWDRMKKSKGRVIVEPTGSQDDFEVAKREYIGTIKTKGKCIILAVFRGKMSEGISFNDDNARGVICVGLPYPNAKDRAVSAKKAYNDEQRKLRNRTNLLPGQEWYQQQAYRALAQALGRCIRHRQDFGVIILMDSRHCASEGGPQNNCGICQEHINLPKWMRCNIRNLQSGSYGLGHMKMFMSHKVGSSPILDGWSGLGREMRKFFTGAREHCSQLVQEMHGTTLKLSQDQQMIVNQQSQSPKISIPRPCHNKIVSPVGGIPRNTIKNQKPIHAKRNSQITLKTMFDRQKAASINPQVSQSPVDSKSLPASAQMIINQAAYVSSSDVIRPDVINIGTEKHPEKSDSQCNNKIRNSDVESPRKDNISPDTAIDSLNDQYLCVVCEEGQRRCLILPCRHLCLCTECANLKALTHCPLCRGKIEDKVNVFI